MVTGAEPGAALPVPRVQERLAALLDDNGDGASYHSSSADGEAWSRGVTARAGAMRDPLSPSLRPPHASLLVFVPSLAGFGTIFLPVSKNNTINNHCIGSHRWR